MKRSVRSNRRVGALSILGAAVVGLLVISSQFAGAASANNPNQSGSGGWRLVSVQGSSDTDGFALFDNKRTWVDRSCRARLERELGRSFEPVHYQSVIEPRTPSQQTCDTVASNVLRSAVVPAPPGRPDFPINPLPPVETTENWRLVSVKGSTNGDGFALKGDGERTWVSPDCRRTLEQNRGRYFEPVDYHSVIAPKPQAAKFATCNKIARKTVNNPITKPVPIVRNEILPLGTTFEFVALQGYNDGWLLKIDGTRQWISADCRNQLAQKKAPRFVNWGNELNDRQDTNSRLSCDQIKAAL